MPIIQEKCAANCLKNIMQKSCCLCVIRWCSGSVCMFLASGYKGRLIFTGCLNNAELLQWLKGLIYVSVSHLSRSQVRPVLRVTDDWLLWDLTRQRRDRDSTHKSSMNRWFSARSPADPRGIFIPSPIPTEGRIRAAFQHIISLFCCITDVFQPAGNS